jgi:hypothetical protein
MFVDFMGRILSYQHPEPTRLQGWYVVCAVLGAVRTTKRGKPCWFGHRQTRKIIDAWYSDKEKPLRKIDTSLDQVQQNYAAEESPCAHNTRTGTWNPSKKRSHSTNMSDLA